MSRPRQNILLNDYGKKVLRFINIMKKTFTQKRLVYTKLKRYLNIHNITCDLHKNRVCVCIYNLITIIVSCRMYSAALRTCLESWSPLFKNISYDNNYSTVRLFWKMSRQTRHHSVLVRNIKFNCKNV